jgi:hypothetical protein
MLYSRVYTYNILSLTFSAGTTLTPPPQSTALEYFSIGNSGQRKHTLPHTHTQKYQCATLYIICSRTTLNFSGEFMGAREGKLFYFFTTNVRRTRFVIV